MSKFDHLAQVWQHRPHRSGSKHYLSNLWPVEGFEICRNMRQYPTIAGSWFGVRCVGGTVLVGAGSMFQQARVYGWWLLSGATAVVLLVVLLVFFQVNRVQGIEQSRSLPQTTSRPLRPEYAARNSVLGNGPLRPMAGNGRYFADETGKVVYLTGSHTWSNFIDSGDVNPPPVVDFTAYLNFLNARNHNFFRLWRAENARGGEAGEDYWFSPMPYQRPGPGVAQDGQPKFDVTRWNQAYFDRMRERVVAAGERGIYVSIMLFDGWSVDSKFGGHVPWIGHPLNAANNINGIDGDPNGNGNGEETHTLSAPISPTITALQEAYVRKVIDTVNDLDNVLYEISNESPVTSVAWQYHMIRYVKEYELTKPVQHPVGMTVAWPGGSNGDLLASPADWISPNGDVNNPPAADGRKVILNDTDHLCGVCGDRKWVWKSLTQGTNPIFMDPYDGVDKERGFSESYDPDNPNDVSIRANLGYARTYAERMNLAVAVPRGELASSGYCLANAASSVAQYLVYQPESGPFNVDLSATPGTLNVEWLNPETGIVTTGTPVAGGATRTLIPPFSGDAVLYLYQNDLLPPAEYTITIPYLKGRTLE
jgi:hypothetical protein